MIDFLRISVARVPVHRRRRAGRGRRRAGRAADHPLATRARALFARVLDNARYLNAGCTSSASTSSSGEPDDHDPIVPVVVGDDWKAVLLWRALYDAGVYVNVALHPAVPPGGALLRTSVMATHDRADARPRARAPSRPSSSDFETEHGPLPGAASHSTFTGRSTATSEKRVLFANAEGG